MSILQQSPPGNFDKKQVPMIDEQAEVEVVPKITLYICHMESEDSIRL